MEQLFLKNQMCFKFYALSRHITSLYKPILAALDLTYPQYLVMLVLWEHELISVKELGQQLMLDSGTLTPLLKRLEQKGLLHRARSQQDERSVNVSLAEQGKTCERKPLVFQTNSYRRFLWMRKM
ncbi:hypothetical protein GCM10028895_03430 [Pontibacter rugosus]